MVLHVVDSATGYSDFSVIFSRELDTIIRELNNNWCHRHGDPASILADQELEKNTIKP